MSRAQLSLHRVTMPVRSVPKARCSLLTGHSVSRLCTAPLAADAAAAGSRAARRRHRRGRLCLGSPGGPGHAAQRAGAPPLGGRGWQPGGVGKVCPLRSHPCSPSQATLLHSRLLSTGARSSARPHSQPTRRCRCRRPTARSLPPPRSYQAQAAAEEQDKSHLGQPVPLLILGFNAPGGRRSLSTELVRQVIASRRQISADFGLYFPVMGISGGPGRRRRWVGGS